MADQYSHRNVSLGDQAGRRRTHLARGGDKDHGLASVRVNLNLKVYTKISQHSMSVYARALSMWSKVRWRHSPRVRRCVRRQRAHAGSPFQRHCRRAGRRMSANLPSRKSRHAYAISASVFITCAAICDEFPDRLPAVTVTTLDTSASGARVTSAVAGYVRLRRGASPAGPDRRDWAGQLAGPRHMAVSGGAPLGGSSTSVTSKPKCSYSGTLSGLDDSR